MAAGESVYLGQENSSIVVQVAMSDPANHTVTNTGSIGGGKAGIEGGATDDPAVILAAGDIFSTAISGIESLRAEAQRNISFSGNVSANSSIDLTAGGKIDVEGLNAGAPNHDQASIWVEADGSVTTGYLNAQARSSVSVVAIAGGDLTITGDALTAQFQSYPMMCPTPTRQPPMVALRQAGLSILITESRQ